MIALATLAPNLEELDYIISHSIQGTDIPYGMWSKMRIVRLWHYSNDIRRLTNRNVEIL